MTQRQREITREHAHSLTEEKLELGMHDLARIYSHLHEFHDSEEEQEIQEILNIDMDEVADRRIHWRK
jgi:hypothetical protein